MNHALEITDLKKVYATGMEALKGIDLTVEEGDFYALLGPNGAGKSTTIGIVTSLVNKTAGQVKVFGYDIDTQLVQGDHFCIQSLAEILVGQFFIFFLLLHIALRFLIIIIIIPYHKLGGHGQLLSC